MGMYTELVISTRIKDDPIAIGTLKYMLGDTEEYHAAFPVHPLFSTDRWRHMLKTSSYYFVPRSMHLLQYDEIGRDWCLICRSDFKNYDNEIVKFVDWIRPYLSDPYEMIGYYRYEECHEPTIIYGVEG